MITPNSTKWLRSCYPNGILGTLYGLDSICGTTERFEHISIACDGTSALNFASVSTYHRETGSMIAHKNGQGDTTVFLCIDADL